MTPEHARPTEGTAWERLRTLPLSIDSVHWRQLQLEVGSAFNRVSTEVIFEGGGLFGRGEETNYAAADQQAFITVLESLPFTGTWTLEEFSAHLAQLDLVPAPLQYADQAPYRLWALESAALDLALRQQELSLARALAREYKPMRFCVSMSVGSPPSLDTVRAWLSHEPSMRFKLDASREWTSSLVDELIELADALVVVDIKGHYKGDWIDNTPDPQLYRQLSRLPSHVLLEDAWIDGDTRPALGEEALRRLSWDAPIHCLGDVQQLEPAPAAINIKPSRFGSLESLFETIEWCISQDLALYAGGQFELGWGRSQAQQIASLFYPAVANDLSPVVFHTARPGDDVPASPLAISDTQGFGFAAPTPGREVAASASSAASV